MQMYIGLTILVTLIGSLTVNAQHLPFCPLPGEGITYFPYYNDCSKYWECYRGSRFQVNCPAGLYWNVKIKSCDYPENVECYQDFPTTSSNNWSPDPDCPYPSDEVTFYPNRRDCSKFYECYKGNKFEMSCPSNLFWNQANHACDFPTSANCVH